MALTLPIPTTVCGQLVICSCFVCELAVLLFMDTSIDSNIETPTGTPSLNAWGKRHIPGFLGVFASDQLPDISRAGQGCLVANYDPSHMPGSHWIGMCFYDGTGYYFDSYGFGPDMDDRILRDKTYFGEYLRRFSETQPVVANHIDLQSRTTDVCGEYSLLYGWAASRGHRIVSANDQFWQHILQQPSQEQRDTFVNSLIRNPTKLNSMLPSSNEVQNKRKRVHFD